MSKFTDEQQAKLEQIHDELLKRWTGKRNFKELFIEAVGNELYPEINETQPGIKSCQLKRVKEHCMDYRSGTKCEDCKNFIKE